MLPEMVNDAMTARNVRTNVIGGALACALLRAGVPTNKDARSALEDANKSILTTRVPFRFLASREVSRHQMPPHRQEEITGPQHAHQRYDRC